MYRIKYSRKMAIEYFLEENIQRKGEAAQNEKY